MREPPRSTSGPAVSNSRSSYGTTSNRYDFPHEVSQFDSYSLHGNYVRDLEQDTSHAFQEQRRKQRKKEKAKVILAEDIDNYVGNKKDIDELVNFIENDGSAKKTKKINHINSPDIPNPSRGDKIVKKTKDKKPKLTPSVSGAIDTDIASGKGEGDSSEKEKADYSEESIMGNSHVKTESDSSEKDEVMPVESESFEIKMNEGKLKPFVVKSADSDNTTQNMVIEVEPVTEETVVEKEIAKLVPNVEDKVIAKLVPNVEDKVIAKLVPNVEDKVHQGKENMKNRKVNNSVKTDNKSMSLVNSDHAENNRSVCKAQVNDNQTSVGCVFNNNLKNSKSKSSSKIVPNSMVTDNNIDLTTAATLVVDDLGGITSFDANYIFTDVDSIPPVEAEFTLVSKCKKKKHVPIRSFHRPAKPRKEVVPVKPFVKEETRPAPAPGRSVTPPPSLSKNTSLSKNIMVTKSDHDRMRDLSPSAFPALGSGKMPFREGRRNSTGDVPVEVCISNLKGQDDSDIESVKSLPASQGGHADNVLSPRLPIVSYAKMAASPKTQGNSQVTNNDDTTDSSEDNKASLVWKGSPTERRHSIGHSPDEVLQRNSDVEDTAPAPLQKSGSQEFPKPNVNPEEMLNIPDPSHNEICVKHTSSKEVYSKIEKVTNEKYISSEIKRDTGGTETNLHTGIQSELSSSELNPKTAEPDSDGIKSTNTMHTNPHVQTNNVVHHSSDTNISVSNSQVKLQSSDSSVSKSNVLRNSFKPAASKNVLKEPVLNASSLAMGDKCNTLPSTNPRSSKDWLPGTKPSTIPRVTNNHKRSRQPKPVIFLDKRVENPLNLGITFGSDEPEIDQSSLLENPNNTAVDKGQQSTPLSSCAANPQEWPSLDYHNSANRDTSNKPPSVKSPVCNTPLTSSQSSSSENVVTNQNDQQNIKNLKKGVHMLGKNGIIVPHSQGSRKPSSPVPAAIFSPSSSSGSLSSLSSYHSESAPVASSETVLGKIDTSSFQVVNFGEAIIKGTFLKEKPKLTNGPITSCGQVKYRPEAGEAIIGHFNLGETVSFLRKEWDKVMQEQTNHPEHVTIFCNQ